jgi:uncharacterized membrane protein YraQ (UPF0718 family)
VKPGNAHIDYVNSLNLSLIFFDLQHIIFSNDDFMLNDFLILFLAVILETLPFLFAGSLLASIVTVFVDETRIQKIMPKNPVLQTLLAVGIGIFFPLCECAIIPLVRGLIKKGVPVRIAITMMLSVPLVNPIAISSTLLAFSGRIHVLFLRLGFGVTIAVIVGLVMSLFKKESVLPDMVDSVNVCKVCGHSHTHEGHHHGHSHHTHSEGKHSTASLAADVLLHTKDEFLDVARFIVLGAIVSSLFQISAPVQMEFTDRLVPSVLFMQFLGYLLSICSHADAFVASSFFGRFSLLPVLAFLIVSPLIDIKNTIVLLGNFKTRFSLTIVLLVFFLVFISVVGTGILYGT